MMAPLKTLRLAQRRSARTRPPSPIRCIAAVSRVVSCMRAGPRGIERVVTSDITKAYSPNPFGPRPLASKAVPSSVKGNDSTLSTPTPIPPNRSRARSPSPRPHASKRLEILPINQNPLCFGRSLPTDPWGKINGQLIVSLLDGHTVKPLWPETSHQRSCKKHSASANRTPAASFADTRGSPASGHAIASCGSSHRMHRSHSGA